VTATSFLLFTADRFRYNVFSTLLGRSMAEGAAMIWYGKGRPGEDSASNTEGEMQGGGDEADRPLPR